MVNTMKNVWNIIRTKCTTGGCQHNAVGTPNAWSFFWKKFDEYCTPIWVKLNSTCRHILWKFRHAWAWILKRPLSRDGVFWREIEWYLWFHIRQKLWFIFLFCRIFLFWIFIVQWIFHFFHFDENALYYLLNLFYCHCKLAYVRSLLCLIYSLILSLVTLILLGHFWLGVGAMSKQFLSYNCRNQVKFYLIIF